VGIAVASVLQAAAAAEPAATLEEVIVTAERRATTELTTAISLNVLTADDLASSRTQNIADLQTSTPNVTINNPGGFNSINIRGIGNAAIQPSINVGVAVFQDGLLNAETITLGNQFLDLATVEVLRGPQGTFVGASSTGGAIRLNSVRPSLTDGTTGYIEGLVGNSSDTKVTGAVNLPISDTFAARIAFNQEKRNSYFYSRGTITGPDPVNSFQRQGSVNDQNARISLLWKPSDNFEAIWRSEMNRTDNEGSPSQPNPRTFTNALGQQTHSRYWNYDGPDATGVGAGGVPVSTIPGNPSFAGGTVDPTHDPDILSSNQLDSQFVGIVDRHSLEMNYSFTNGMTFRSLTGFVHNENQYIEDYDSSFAQARVDRNDVGPDNNYYSQEFNLISDEGPFNWILGASYFYRMTPVNLIFEETPCGIDPANGVFTPCPDQFSGTVPGLVVISTETTARSGGLFGQVNWTFVDNLEATLGFRWNVDKNFSNGRDFAGGVNPVIPAPPGVVPGTQPCPADLQAVARYSQVNWANTSCFFVGENNSYEEETPTWKVGLNWKPGDNNLLYAFWSRGYKSGGVDMQGPFAAEEVEDYELGWKGTFADGRAQLSLGGFYMNYANMQQQGYKATTVTAGNTVFNVGESTIQGIEAEFNGKFGGFLLQASVGWVDSELGSISAIDRTAALDSDVRAPLSNQDLPQCSGAATYPTCVDWTPYYRSVAGLPNLYSPELQYTASVSYDFLVGNGTWTPRVTYAHTDEQDINLIRREDFWLIPKRDLLNLSLTYTLNDWLVQAYCNNCSDETYIAAIGTGGGLDNNSVVYGSPLNYGIRLRKSF
jgi:iron complex outermembrane receptor protein